MTAASLLFARALGLPPATRARVRVQRDLQVPGAAGVTLLADRYAPARAAAAGAAAPPLVLIRGPYGRRGVWGLMGRFFAERGLQAVVQSCRGTFGSGGQLDPFGLAERDDALATVEWLRARPWYPGSFGTWGPSYLGITQWALATAALPDHKAMVICVASCRPRDLIEAGGAFALQTMLRWTDQVARQERPGASVLQGLRDPALSALAGQLPLGRLDSLATGRTFSWWQDWLAASQEFWDRHDFGTGPRATRAPVLLIGGWHDIFLPSQLHDYHALRAAGSDPKLVIGPWRHADPAAVRAWLTGGLEFLRAELGSPPADPGSQPGPQPVPEHGSRVRIFVTGADQWRELPCWPPAGRAAPWYLQPGGALAPGPPTVGPPDTFTYNPADPTPNLAGPLNARGPARVDNRMIEARPDVLTFTSAPLAAALEIAGVASVDLHVRSSREHTDVFARLCEVNPAGQSFNITDGLLRLAPGAPPAGPDGIRRVRFELWPAAHRFAAGSRLRLQVSSGAHPRYARNLGTGAPQATAATLIAAEQAVFHDPARPSAVILPVTRGLA